MQVFAVLLGAVLLLASPAPAREPDWSALAKADVEAAYRLTRDNHPGVYDPANPGFSSLLEKVRREALKTAEAARTPAGFEAALSRFGAVLDDGHAGAYAALPEKYWSKIRWPGFMTAWRGDGLYVFKSLRDDIPEGSRIKACDGMDIRRLVEQKIFGFETGRKVPGRWWSSARLVLVDDGNPFAPPPQTCVFLIRGHKRALRLEWSPVPEDYAEWRRLSISGDTLQIGISERATGLFWIALPDFSPDSKGIEAYKQLLAEVDAKHAVIANSRAVVLDLRHNEGGSSTWSKSLAERLWGAGAVARAQNSYFAKTRIMWRPTPGNLKEVKNFVPILNELGDPDAIQFIKRFLPIMEAATARGDRFIEEPDLPIAAPAVSEDNGPKVSAPVYVIVPGQCASACLDAVDLFRLFPGVKLVGAPSSSDSSYMEVRTQLLPSGMAHVILPMKLYVNRPRGNGSWYKPDIPISDLDWSTDTFLKTVEQDLGRRSAR
jgi:hypothetical protein